MRSSGRRGSNVNFGVFVGPSVRGFGRYRGYRYPRYGYRTYGYPRYRYPTYGYPRYGYGAYGYSGYGYGIYGLGAGYSRYGYAGYGSSALYYDPYYDLGAVRLEVDPRHAGVFVDGYFVGLVNDFDGVFQRLRLEGGPHQIEIEADGFEPLVFDVRVVPGQTIKYKGRLRPRP